MARKLEELVYFKIDNCFYIIIVFIKLGNANVFKKSSSSPAVQCQKLFDEKVIA